MIKITAKDFAKIVSGELIGISGDEIINQVPVINSKPLQQKTHSLPPLWAKNLMAMIMF
jgi:hypothetical protein